MRLLLHATYAVILFLAYPAFAGPPFFTDDPDPGEYQHWEINTAFQSTHTRGDTTGNGSGVEINYGALPNLQVHVTPLLVFDRNRVTGMHYGYGDTEFGVKYRFLNPGENDWWPQVAIAPLVQFPTGNFKEGLSTTGERREYVSLSLLKDFGAWTTYGSGGYWNNEGAGNKNYWFFGWAAQRRITEALTLGGELYHQTSDTIVGNPAGVASTGFNLGGAYDLSEHYHLLFSAGQALDNVAATNAFSCYLGVQWTF